MKFTLLGPVTAVRSHQPLDLGPPQQRGFLARLLLARESTLSDAVLIDALWGDTAPDSALNALRIYVHRLRRTLDSHGDASSSLLERVGGGYRINQEGIQVDLSLFSDLAAQGESARRNGNPAAATTYLRKALSLWHGDPLLGIKGAFVEAHRQRLERLRFVVLLRLNAWCRDGWPLAAVSPESCGIHKGAG
ncbi:BTAD domain-containing putative transcriptional regulator [Streptomyces globisporus]|uniref:AfsR/SARP family transcriptional regulator n=1 Tax=Streptomyces globisporus TaxID=1908 RepID=UPI002F90820E